MVHLDNVTQMGLRHQKAVVAHELNMVRHMEIQRHLLASKTFTKSQRQTQPQEFQQIIMGGNPYQAEQKVQHSIYMMQPKDITSAQKFC